MPAEFKAKVITFNGYNEEGYKGTQTSGPLDPNFHHRIVCEGDSWFSLGAVPSSNLLYPMQFEKSTLLVNLARPGDTIKNMSTIAANPVLNQIINAANFAIRFDAILLSGGGNDLIEMANQIICTPSPGAGKHMHDYIDAMQLHHLRTRVQDGYKKIAALRVGSINANTPIVTHVYDYPTPREAKAKFLGIDISGPWIYSALKTYDVPEEFWVSITDYLFEYLAVSIIELGNVIDNFHVVSTQGTLVRARTGTTGTDNDWLNEIHPTGEGYEKLARIIACTVDHILQSPQTPTI